MIPTATIHRKSFLWGLWAWIKNRPAMFAINSLIALGVGSALWFTVWMATDRHVTTTVHDISWMHMTHLRERVEKHAEGWYRQSTKGYYQEPVFNQVCETKFHYMETYVCGYTHYTCGKSTCSSPIYCSRPVFDEYCSYDYYDWPVKDTKQILGYDHNTEWGTYTLGPNQRMQMISSYEVNFDGDFQYRPTQLDDYKRFTPGDKWKLTVGRIRRHNIEKMVQISK